MSLPGRDEAPVFRYDVRVFKAGDKYKVRPGVTGVPEDGVLWLKNTCEEPITLALPGAFTVRPADVPPQGEASVALNGDRAELRGTYEYAVIVRLPNGSRLAEGESGPTIIID